MKILIEESVLRQAIDVMYGTGLRWPAVVDTITALRDAIEQSEKRTPSLWINGTTKDCTFNPHTADNWLKQGHAVRPYYKD